MAACEAITKRDRGTEDWVRSMMCSIFITDLGQNMVVEMSLVKDGKARQTSWKSEVVVGLPDVLALLPEIARKLQAGEIGI